MQAVVMQETGTADVLRLEEAERPEPGDGQVLIGVRAASVNAIDWKYQRGFVDRQLPAVLGNDISGTVEASRASPSTKPSAGGFERSWFWTLARTALGENGRRRSGRASSIVVAIG